MGLTVHGASKRPATSEKNGAACESALRKNGQTVLAQLEPSQLRSSKLPGFAREDFIRARCRNRRQLPPTAANSSISSAGFTTADDVSAFAIDTLCLESSVSTERETGERCSPNLVAGRRRRTCGADSSISSASCTIADDVSALSVDTSISDNVRDTMP